MSYETPEILVGLRHAMQSERTGYEFYKLAASRTEDPVGRLTFERLANEEEEHFNFLAAHYRALQTTGQLAEGITWSDSEPMDATSPIFGQDLRGRLQGAHFEMSALAIGVQLELNAITHYRKEMEKAEAAGNEPLRAFFDHIVTWETGHYRALLAEQDALQQAYWQEAGFEPF